MKTTFFPFNITRKKQSCPSLITYYLINFPGSFDEDSNGSDYELSLSDQHSSDSDVSSQVCFVFFFFFL